MEEYFSEQISDFSGIRKEYLRGQLDEQQVFNDPLIQFGKWMQEALRAGIPEPNAMILATTGSDMQPSARVVLLKDFGKSGFVFFTNYTSLKGKQISENQRVALTFFWAELERQVRIEGIAEKADVQESQAYFYGRPLESQLSALVSPQSRPIASRDYLERLVEEKRKQLAGDTIPYPSHWGGYVVKPHRIEFWQGRLNRLHDRILYELQPDGHWKISRLAP